MSATCIVCLGDLEEDRKPAVSDAGSDLANTCDPGGAHDPTGSEDLIAHLLPCGHDLHNECLKPWVERANSCPICRANFNQVTLCSAIGGAEVSSYTVENKVQVAELDPAALYEDFAEEEDEPQPCEICGCSDNQELLLLCEGCDLGFHTACVNLDFVPTDDFWCESCQAERALNGDGPRSYLSGPPQRFPPRYQHTLGRHHLRSLRAAHFHQWERVWQSVFDNLDLDLDNPSDENEPLSQFRESQRSRMMSRRADHRSAWEARQDVAEEQGGAEARFEDTRPALLNRFARRKKSETPPPIPQDELRAWDAFDKAKEAEVARPGKRKRQSKTTSPVEPGPSQPPERKLKRPNTKSIRRQELGESSTSTSAGQSGSASRSLHSDATSAGPSFLQSILKTVEGPSESASSKTSTSLRGSASTAGPLRGQGSPASSSSPVSSPSTSNHSSPRALSATPPPLPPAAHRFGSPPSLTSKIEPISRGRQTFSPSTSPSESSRPSKARRSETREHYHSRGRHPEQRACSSGDKRSRHVEGEARSSESSPTRRPDHRVGSSEGSRSRPRTRPASRHGSSPETSPERARKADIQLFVKNSLRPHHQKGLSKDNYTNINRDTSRKLYSEIGSADIVDEEARAAWQQFADEEVDKAVAELNLS